MSDCPQDQLNRIWRLFAAQGVGDDMQIIEALSYHLLRLADYDEQLDLRSYPQPILLNQSRTTELETLLAGELAKKSAAELLNHCLLFRPDSMQAGGRYPTPRHIARLMADLARLFVSDNVSAVADFACGSAGLLVELAGHNVTGIEISPTWARIARANLLLHGMPADEVYTGDALAVIGSRVTNSFNIVAMNPPFGSPLEAALVEQRLGEGKGTRSETVLALLALNRLRPNGVLTVLQPGGALFSTSSGEATLRNRLLTENQLEAIVQLPKDAFQPYSQLQTYLLLARKTKQSSIEADAPVWFYHITHDGFGSGRNRQPQPEHNQLPELIAAVATGQADEHWDIRDTSDTQQLDIRPLATGGYRIVQPDDGKLAVTVIRTTKDSALWLARQTEDTQHALLFEAALWQQELPPDISSSLKMERLAFQLADDSGQAVSLERSNNVWQFTLKSSKRARPCNTLTPDGGLLALFVTNSGQLLSPPLLVEEFHKDYKPKTLATFPLNNLDNEAAGSVLLWDSSAVSLHYFCSETGDMGWFLIAGDEEAALIGWEGGELHRVEHGAVKRTFAGETWHRGVVVDGDGTRFGVGVAPTHIRDERQFDLTFDRCYLPDDSEPTVQKSAAEILADMRHKQHELAGRLDYLLGVVEMRPARALPPAVVDVTPLGTLNHSQRLIWQRILSMTETVGEVVTARPFRYEDLAVGLNAAEVQQALTLFERMGLIVPVSIDGAPYFRRVTERDVITA